MLNCKPGDLAVIVCSPTTPENIGKLVRVIRPAVQGEKIGGWHVQLKDNYFAWIVESEGSGLAWGGVARLTGQPRITYEKVRAYADYCLRPIRGDHTAKDIEREKSCSI